jgi:hypothetical protein
MKACSAWPVAGTFDLYVSFEHAPPLPMGGRARL